jgi:hypothetical protein
MFGSKKKAESRYIVAVKDYDNTLKAIKDGTIKLPYDKSIYVNLLESHTLMISKLNELGKMVKSTRKAKKEVRHFWTTLIDEGYSLLNVAYSEKSPTLEQLSSKDLIRYVGAI